MVLHSLDLAVIVVFLFVVVYSGHRFSKETGSDERFFLAGRKLGWVFQFFLSFGNATEPQSALSAASLVFQRGVTGVWSPFQTLALTPYFWFMNTWFRRVRLVTLSDLFEDRLGSLKLSRLYVVFQVGVTCVVLGFGNVVAYKITSTLVLKPTARWTAADRQSVEDYAEHRRLDSKRLAGPLPSATQARLDALRDRQERGELYGTVTALPALPFYLAFATVVGAYVFLGGMGATARNAVVQGALVIIFSVLLIPTGLVSIGGWGELGRRVPKAMFELFGRSGGAPLLILSVLFTNLVQIHAVSHNMIIFGSAKNEFAASFGGVAGAYAKHIVIGLWAFVGLIGLALVGEGGLPDPDAIWGVMSNRLLEPGFVGLMLAGALAAAMSALATKVLAMSSLFVRNFYWHFRPTATQAQGIFAARCSIIAMLVLGVICAELMNDFETFLRLLLTINLPFGAAVILMFFWRRLTVPAVWASVLLSTFAILIAPLAASSVKTVRQHPALVEATRNDAGRLEPVYFKDLVRRWPEDPASPLEGRGRFNFECWALSRVGLQPAALTAAGRETARFLFDGLFPFLVLLVVSGFTRPPDHERLDQFFGKMKTPVGATAAMEAAAMAVTRRHPQRYDFLKLFPESSWEFTTWDRTDAVRFLSCCAASAAIFGVFVGLLLWVGT